VKFLDRLPDGDEEGAAVVLERFRFEAQISARLGARTKSIVAVYDAGTHGGVPYLVMEYVRGRTLESIIDERGMIPLDRFADILDQVAEALAIAHDLGIVHRDIKPSNIMLVDTEPAAPEAPRPEGAPAGPTVKLADFGVAKAVRADLTLDRPKETSEGLLVGSPAYMSPEQLRCDGTLDPRTDVWSLGVVAYEALTGWPPFAGGSIADLIVSISTRPVDPPSSIHAGLPRAIDAWFGKALAKDRAQRFASPKEMAAAFRVAARGAPASGRRRRGVFVWAIAATGALVALAVAVRFAGSRAEAPSAAPTSAPEPTASERAPEPLRPTVDTPLPAPETATPATATPPRGAVPERSPRATPSQPAPRQPEPAVVPAVPAPPSAAPSASASAPRPRKEINPSEIQ